MKVKGYWKVTYKKKAYGDYNFEGEKIIKAKNVQKAVENFYTCENCWYQKNDYYVVAVEPHSITEGSC